MKFENLKEIENMKKFSELKKNDTIFLVGSPDFIMHEDIVENFGLFIIESVLETLDGKRNPIICLSGKYLGAIDAEKDKRRVAYFTATKDSEINDYTATIRVDEWSEIFTKTVSKNLSFLCFQDVNSGLDYLDMKFDKYKEDIEESRKINEKALKGD